MDPLPPIPWPTSPVSHPDQRLLRWLVECGLDTQLARAGPPPTPEPSTLDTAGEPAGSSQPRPPLVALQEWHDGDVLLLWPDATPAATTEVCGVVLHRQDQESLFTPFSRYREPATPDEFLVLPEASRLRVLQVWNTRRLAPEQIRRAWFCGALPAPALADLVRFHDALATGAPIPPDLAARAGAPLDPFGSDFDPRPSYLRDGLARLHPLPWSRPRGAVLLAVVPCWAQLLWWEATERAREGAVGVAQTLHDWWDRLSRSFYAEPASGLGGAYAYGHPGVSIDHPRQVRCYRVANQTIHLRLIPFLGNPAKCSVLTEGDAENRLEAATLLGWQATILGTLRSGRAEIDLPPTQDLVGVRLVDETLWLTTPEEVD